MPHPARGLVLLFPFLAAGAQAQQTPKSDAAPLAVTLQVLDRHCIENGPHATPAELAWCMLAMLANGSTLRSGDHRNALKAATSCLRTMQDEQGHFAPGGARCDRDSQIVATVAMNAAYLQSHYALLKPNVVKAAKALLDDLGGVATIEQAALLAWLGEELHPAGAVDPTTIEAIETAARAKVATHRAGTSRRADAAFQLAQLLLGKQPDADLVVAQAWPANLLADPLHTMFAVLAVQRTGVDAKKQQQAEDAVLQGLLTQRVADGEAIGTWPASAPLDAVTTTAMLAYALGVAALPPK